MINLHQLWALTFSLWLLAWLVYYCAYRFDLTQFVRWLAQFLVAAAAFSSAALFVMVLLS